MLAEQQVVGRANQRNESGDSAISPPGFAARILVQLDGFTIVPLSARLEIQHPSVIACYLFMLTSKTIRCSVLLYLRIYLKGNLRTLLGSAGLMSFFCFTCCCLVCDGGARTAVGCRLIREYVPQSHIYEDRRVARHKKRVVLDLSGPRSPSKGFASGTCGAWTLLSKKCTL